MIKIKSIKLRNFLSYGERITEISLDKNGTTLIIGKDLDNTSSGTGANGVGKTAIVNALVYALYGKTISNISLDRLINNINKKNMLVEVEFEKDDKVVVVRRARKEKGNGNYAKVFIRNINEKLNEDIHDKTPDSVNNINKFIEDILEIPFELFVRIVSFVATHTPFLELPLRQQSDMMEELFKLTQLSTKAENLKEEIKNTKQSLEIKIKHNEQLEKEHERHKNQINRAKDRVDEWEKQRKDNIEKLLNKLKELSSIDIEKQENIFNEIEKLKELLLEKQQEQKNIENVIININADFKTIKTSLKTLLTKKEDAIAWETNRRKKLYEIKKSADLLPEEHVLKEQEKLNKEAEELEEKINILNDNEKEKETIISGVKLSIGEYEEELKHLLDEKCPYCLQKYENSKEKLKHTDEMLNKTKNDLDSYTKELESIKKEKNDLIEKLNKIKNEIIYSANEIAKFWIERENHANKLQELFDEKSPYGNGQDIIAMDNEIQSLKKYEKELKEKLDSEAEKLLNSDNVVSELTEKINNLKKCLKIKTLEEIYDIKNSIKNINTEVESIKNEVNPYLEPLKELEEIKLEPIDIDTVNKLDKKLTHQNYLLKLLTKKDSFIRKNLLNRNLDFLNQRLKIYLNTLGLPHRVEFTEEMTANISRFGRELDFGNLSSGQKARVNLALSFAFRDVLQKAHDEINVCIFDEVLDVGLDGVGVQNAARMLKQKARDENLSFFIISHRDEVSGIFDRKLIVKMEKGFSTIEYQ